MYILSSILFFLLQSISFLQVASATCYWPNGKERNETNPSDPFYTPCTSVGAPDSGAAMCCGGADTCLGNGLCYSSGSKQYWRESCTDPTWEDPSCVRLFITGINQANNSANADDALISLCADGSWCPVASTDDQTSNCCQRDQHFWIGDGDVNETTNRTVTNVNPNSTTTSSATTTTPTSSTPLSSATAASATISPVASPTPTPVSGTNTAAIAGGVVGGVVGLALIAGVAWWLLRRRRRASSVPPPANWTGADERKKHELEDTGITEADGRTSQQASRENTAPPVELPGDDAAELP